MADHETETTYALALSSAIEVLRGMLGEAIDYLDHDKHLAALGTLVMFEEQAEDLKAAIRLFQRSIRMRKRRTK